MKRTFTLSATVLAALACTAPLFLFSPTQSLKAKVLFADPVNGVVTARETKTGRTFQFTLPADVASGVKVGDAVDVDLGGMRVTGVKGAARTAQIREPDSSEPCCNVVAFATDSAALEALLRGLSGAEPTGATNAANPNMDTGSALKALLARVSNAEPVGANSATVDFRSLLKGVEPINGAVDPAEPVGAIVLLRNITTNAYHVVAVSGTPPPGAIGSGATAAIDERSGLAYFRASNQTFSHPLYRPAKGGPENKGPWEITPDASLKGITGKLLTNFPQDTDGAWRGVWVYNVGTTDQVSYMVIGEPHVIVEGEYDVKVNDVKLLRVPIKKGHVTRILLGALKFAAGGQNRRSIWDASGKTELFQMNEYETVGIPQGTYSIKAGSRVVTFEIRDGEVTAI
jgi:hypothetical protein